MYNEEWIEYYQYLEVLRESGVTNMFGATPYIEAHFEINRKEAKTFLINWMKPRQDRNSKTP